MAKALKYEKQTTITISASGILDLENETIDLEGEEVKVIDLFKDFDGACISISVKLADKEKLDFNSESAE